MSEFRYENILREKPKIESIWDAKNKWECLQPDPKTGQFNWTKFKQGDTVLGGVYRVICCIDIDFQDFTISGSKKIAGTITKETVLSVGKSGNLAQRFKQHFSAAAVKSHRLLDRFRDLYKEEQNIPAGMTWLKKAITGPEPKFRIEYCILGSWWERDILECYGRSCSCSLFDLDAER